MCLTSVAFLFFFFVANARLKLMLYYDMEAFVLPRPSLILLFTFSTIVSIHILPVVELEVKPVVDFVIVQSDVVFVNLVALLKHQLFV